MRSIVRSSRLATLAAFAAAGTLALAGVTPAGAATLVTFVGSLGDDANTCTSPQQPCRSLASAYDKTAAGGQINILDGGLYGGLEISRSITIDGEAAKDAVIRGTIFVGTGDADVVVLRGLVFKADTGQTSSGIFFRGSGTLQVEGCVIDGLQSINGAHGIRLDPTGNSRVLIADTVVRNFVGTNGHGLRLSIERAGLTRLSLERVSLVGNNIGMSIVALLSDGVMASVRDSMVAQNQRHGIEITGNPLSDVMIERTGIVGNGGIGVFSGKNAIVRLRTVTVTHNGTGIFPHEGGRILSYGDNVIDANGTNGTPTEVGTLK